MDELIGGTGCVGEASEHLSVLVWPLLAAILVIGIGWGGVANGQGTITLDDGVKARLMALEALRGAKVDAGFLAGRPVLVTFFASWCPPCRTSIPHLTELQEKFKDRGVNIIGVSNEELATVESFVKKMGDKMAYTVAIDAGATSKGYMGKYGVGGIPHAFVVKDGAVVWHGHPMVELEAAIADSNS